MIYNAGHRYTNIGQKVFPVLVYPHTVGPQRVGQVLSVSSFGVDGAGHLFALSLSGTLYELR